MWAVGGFFFLLLLVVLVTFFGMNSNRTVDIDLFGREYLDVQIFWVLLLSFLLGFLTCFVMAAVRELRIHGQIRALKRTVAAREKEIAELRTLPLQDFPVRTTAEASDG